MSDFVKNIGKISKSIEVIEYFDLVPEDNRLTFFPIARPGIFKYYQDALKQYWTVGEICTTTDTIHYQTKLTSGERRSVDFIVAFFAASDGIVNVNIAKRLKKDVKMQDAQYFYNFQISMEDIHAHTYSILLDAIIPRKEDRDRLINAAATVPSVKLMTEYMFKIIDSTEPLPKRLLMTACVEGIFFTGCFCIIYWLQNRGLMPALGHSNELIAKDESLHTYFSMYLYTLVKPQHKLAAAEIRDVFTEAVDIAIEFIKEALPQGMIGMNAELMIDYIKCQADNLASLIDLPVVYGTKHNFHFMDQINMTNRTNFFERRVSEYAKTQSVDDGTIATDF